MSHADRDGHEAKEQPTFVPRWTNPQPEATEEPPGHHDGAGHQHHDEHFLADGNGEFAKAIDMAFDGSGNGLATRSKRYSMLVEDGVVKKLNIEEAPGKCDVSGGQALLGQL